MELAHCSVKLLLFCLVTWRDWGSARHVASPSGAINVMLFGIDVRITPEASCCGRCNEDTPFRQVYVTCYCDKFCLTYQDCCLDYELYCTNLEERLIKDRDHELLEAFQNCSKSMETLATPGIAPSNSSANDRDLCLIWYPERAQSLVDEFACKMEALWVPVILARKPNRTLIFVATGMSWILIFILGYVDVEGFSYFFTVLIAIQGPLLFFSFAFTERVRAMWRVRITRLLQAQTDTLEEASDTRKSALQGSRVADTEMDLLYQSKPSESEERA
ncbi:uncharacterized protein LOC110979342 isoform X2 [Acanthaster planci]|uniref:Uncharacterized protein LOC110979342 isoform X2 n=1 Tax=Acanthaster planci TaxID=133434 RepID=A0A8B7YEC1_ACAPL|nr:uncharacterized protein LOC110979342 isoform X2 [Acanthaster planci]